ncbi:MAG: nucleotidyltransferase domain-containing protein [Elusimicrobia bacterium]|nr:nucleotidyltransferase domain-containing protein [Elusimicrobiota bacterium]
MRNPSLMSRITSAAFLYAFLCPFSAGAVENREIPGKSIITPLVIPGAKDAAAQLPGVPALPELPKAAGLEIPANPAGPESPEPGAALPQPQGAGAILQALSPENSAKVSGEESADLAAQLIDPREGVGGAGAADVVPDSGAGVSGSGLAAAQTRSEGRSGRVSAPGRAALASNRPSLRRELEDRAVFARVLVRQFWWYAVTHIVDRQDRNMWPSFHARWKQARDDGVAVPVTDARRFFTHMRVMGESGIFYVLGFSARRDEAVMAEAHQTFRDYLMGPGVGSREEEALDAFLHRALGYNKEKRAHSNFRKHVRDALLAVALRPSSEMAAEFNSRMREDTFAKTAEYQAGRQEVVLSQLRQAVNETVAEESRRAADRVVGAVLLGSFATGSAGPKSDFDIELITANGGRMRMKAFEGRLQSRWKALGLQVHPIGIHESADPPSKGVIKRIHSGPYIVISPDPVIEAALSRAPDEAPFFEVERELTWKGRIGRAVQYAIVYLSTLWADVRDHFSGASGPGSIDAKSLRPTDPRRAVQLETVGTFWDERHLRVPRLPIEVGELGEKTAFSRPLAEQYRKVQAMTVKEPGSGLKLPEGLAQFRETLAAALSFEKRINPEFDRYYAYLFVSQGPVAAGASQRRPNAHTDGYPRRPHERGEVDRMYLVSDALPTQFFDQPFPVPTAEDFAGIHQTFEDAADPARVVTHAPYTLTMMDSYTVHRAAKAEEPIFRTFVQVHLSARRFDRPTNTRNPLLTEPARTDLAGRWRAYEARRRESARSALPVVLDPRSFFAETVDFGLLWWARSYWGPRISLDAAVRSARRVVRRYFEPGAPGSAAAFESFLDRVLSSDNPESPNAKRKRIGAALIETSLLPGPSVVGHIETLFGEPERRADAEFRRVRQQDIVASFREQVDALISAKSAERADYNVTALILSGSYADGSAKATSDFDFVVLTRDGTRRDVMEFMADLERLRTAHGWPGWEDWRRYPGENVLGARSMSARRFVSERPVVVISPDADLREKLTALRGGRQVWDAGRLEILGHRLAGPFHRRRVLTRLGDGLSK